MKFLLDCVSFLPQPTRCELMNVLSLFDCSSDCALLFHFLSFVHVRLHIRVQSTLHCAQHSTRKEIGDKKRRQLLIRYYF